MSLNFDWRRLQDFNPLISLTNGGVWNIEMKLEFDTRLKIQLNGIDNPDFPLSDDLDRSGSALVRPA